MHATHHETHISGLGRLSESIRRLIDRPSVRIIPRGLKSSDRLAPIVADLNRQIRFALHADRRVTLAARRDPAAGPSYLLVGSVAHLSGDLVIQLRLVEADSLRVAGEVRASIRESRGIPAEMGRDVASRLVEGMRRAA